MDAAADFYGIDPRRVAVVLVDFQNDFCSPEVFGDRPATNTHNAVTAASANRFAGNAHRLGEHVIYTQQVFDSSKLTERQRRTATSDDCARPDRGAPSSSSSRSGMRRSSSRIGTTAGRVPRG